MTRCDLATLERSFPEANGELRAHLTACARCGAAWGGWSEVAALGRALPTPALGDSRRLAMRDAIVVRAEILPRRRSRTVFVGAAVAALALSAAAAVVLATRPRRAEPGEPRPAPVAARPTKAGTVHAHDGASYLLVGGPPDEIVRLLRGTITVEVEPLSPGHRYRVVTGDAEVEVRGTVFEVTARDDRLISVHVLHGRVEVRRAGEASHTLDATQRWAQASPAPPPGPAGEGAHPTAGVRAPHRAQASQRRVPRARPDELRYQEGWDALRGGDLLRAATAFEETAAQNGSLAAEATYWRAVALGRAGRPAEAASALQTYLGLRAPPRGDEAAAMLGWLLFERGDRDGAKRLFERAAGSHVAASQDSGRRGLEALRAEPSPSPASRAK